VERYLKLFTFLPISDIKALMKEHTKDPSKRIPQHRLAYEFVDLVHGVQAAKSAEYQHRTFFKKATLSSLTSSAPETPSPADKKLNPLQLNQNPEKRLEGSFLSRNLNKYAPLNDANNSPPQHIVLPRSTIYNQPIARVLYSAGLVASRSEGHRLTENKGAYVAKQASGKTQMSDDLTFVPAKLHDPQLTWNNVIRDEAASGEMQIEGEEGLLILRVGKWKIRVIRIVSDEKFDKMGLPAPPGWAEMKAQAAVEGQKAALEQADPKEATKGRRKREFAEFKKQQNMGREFFREKHDGDEDGSAQLSQSSEMISGIQIGAADRPSSLSEVNTTGNTTVSATSVPKLMQQPGASFPPQRLNLETGSPRTVTREPDGGPLRRVMTPGPSETRAASKDMMRAWKKPVEDTVSTPASDAENGGGRPAEVQRSEALEAFRALLKPFAPHTEPEPSSSRGGDMPPEAVERPRSHGFSANAALGTSRGGSVAPEYTGGFRTSADRNVAEAMPGAKREARQAAGGGTRMARKIVGLEKGEKNKNATNRWKLGRGNVAKNLRKQFEE